MDKKLLQMIAIAIFGAVGEVLLYVGPFFVGAVTEALQVDSGMAGMLFGAEILVSAVTAFATSSQLKKLPGRLTMAGSLILMMVGDGASFFVGSFAVLCVCRIVAAVGAGAVFAGANAMGAGTQDPGKTYTAIGTGALILAIAAFVLIPIAQTAIGPKAIFVVLVMLTAPAAVFAPFLPGFAGAACPPESKNCDRNGRDFNYPIFAALAVVLFMYLGSNGLWAYVERIGVEVNKLDADSIGNVLIAAAVVATGAPILANFLQKRIGLVTAAVIGLLLQAIGSLVIVYFSSVQVYGAMAVLVTAALIFVLTLAKIGMAGLDPSGRVVGTSTGLITIGSGFGPFVGGTLLNSGFGYISLGWLAAGCMLVCIFAAIVGFGAKPGLASISS